MKPKRLVELVVVGLVVTMAVVMNAKAGAILNNGLKPGTVASMTNLPGIRNVANRPNPLKDLAGRPMVTSGSAPIGCVSSSGLRLS